MKRDPETQAALAHVDSNGRPHPVQDHLRAVGELAASFAASFGSAEWARLAGRWHDLGKFAADFQARIRAANGLEVHIEDVGTGKPDHSTAGALHAHEHLGGNGVPLAFVIAGHHGGLPDRSALRERLLKKKDRLRSALERNPPAEILNAVAPTPVPQLAGAKSPEALRALEMWTRMIFSALCDADFLDTEAFLQPDQSALRGGYPSIVDLEQRLSAFLARLQATAAQSEVNRVRSEVLAACIQAAREPPGVFSLTVPTGGGKTLASMAFALAHARQHGLERVIVAIPYTSIIEQSGAAYAAALGTEAVLEHHSAFDPDKETPRTRLAAENWDAPVIVTTTVQLFESLFANRPGACRKLHRLARSVIVLDEAQTLPPALLRPIADSLRTLVEHYGASVVVSTATQPALAKSSVIPEGLVGAREIVPASIRAFERLRRVRVRWPGSDEPTAYEELAKEIARERDVLAIVHLRKDARSLCELVDREAGSPAEHLSALMCPAHRSEALARIRERKKRGEPVRLVSTQLVEAGVDVDFAVVYRALGGLDSLAQAAGRCNREGRLPFGELRVYRAPTQPPRGVARAALGVAQGLLAEHPELDLFAAGTFDDYFRRLYRNQDLDGKQIQKEREALQFKEVAGRFRMIEDDWSAAVVVPWGDDAPSAIADLEKYGPSRRTLRALQRFSVTVPRVDRDAWLRTGIARMVADQVAYVDGSLVRYDERFGLLPESAGRADAATFFVE